jgi:hypothetical protein
MADQEDPTPEQIAEREAQAQAQMDELTKRLQEAQNAAHNQNH